MMNQKQGLKDTINCPAVIFVNVIRGDGERCVALRSFMIYHNWKTMHCNY